MCSHSPSVNHIDEPCGPNGTTQNRLCHILLKYIIRVYFINGCRQRSAHKSQRPTGWFGVRIMVWVGTSLPTRGVVFQWASTIKTSRRSDQQKTGPVHTHQHLHTRTCSQIKPFSLVNLVPVAMRLKNCQSDYKTSSLTHSTVVGKFLYDFLRCKIIIIRKFRLRLAIAAKIIENKKVRQ